MEGLAQQYFPNYAPEITRKLKVLTVDFETKSRRFKIWAAPEARSGLEQIDNLLDVFLEIQMRGAPKDGGPDNVPPDISYAATWAKKLKIADEACAGLPDKLISWYRDGEALDLKLPSE